MTTRILLVLLSLVVQNAMAVEEPQYDVLAETGSYEIRRYSPYVVAEVDVAGRSSDSQGFRTLAGFIFGDNESGEKMRMTAPVESRDASASGGSTYAFVMERKYTLDTLPKPNNPDIRIREKLERIVAVRRFSGRWTERAFASHEQQLLRDLADDGVKTTGPTELARYNGPMTPWFLRRNEIMVPVSWPAASQ